jgi:dUTP pyrophosphatase
MVNKVDIDFTIEDKELIPFYAKFGDAGMDLRASKEVVINSGQTVIVPTGIRMAIPLGFMVSIIPRSGISLNTPLRIANSPGTIDSGYRDEIGIIVSNISSEINTNICFIDNKSNHQGDYIIRKGDKVAQMVLLKYFNINLIQVEKLNLDNDRKGGFGSTGV